MLAPWGDFENRVTDVEEAEDGWEEGCEFAKGDDLEEQQDDSENEEENSEKGSLPVGEDSCFHITWFGIM